MFTERAPLTVTALSPLTPYEDRGCEMSSETDAPLSMVISSHDIPVPTRLSVNLRLPVPVKTTENSVNFLKKEYPGEAWAQRQPQVLRGTSLSGDNYWKGINDHNNALLITETYKCTDPYAITEMEDVATALAVQRLGLLDRLIILRTAVNIDVFPSGVTPEMLWGADIDDSIASEDSMESVDIFETAMENCFNVGKVLIDAILEGTL